MGRLIITLIAVIILGSCEQKNDQSVASSDSAISRDKVVTPLQGQEKTLTPNDDETTGDVPDSSPYIGDLSAFESTHEYYTTVYYRDEGSDNYDFLAGKADSLVYEDEEMRRKKIPPVIAAKYFNLSGLASISVYHNGERVSEATLARVELLEGLIESQFIAVFKPVQASSFTSEVSYCVSSGDLDAKAIDIAWRPINDSLFTKDVLKEVNLEPKPWFTVHVKAMPYDATYSGITYQFKSYLVETRSGKSVIVKQIDKDYYIGDILPLHLEINGKPALLLRMGVNETDMVWTSLAVYSGTQYEFLEGNRLRGKVYL